jgi:hypothetical protein
MVGLRAGKTVAGIFDVAGVELHTDVSALADLCGEKRGARTREGSNTRSPGDENFLTR